jgi:hypothetical protein
MNPFMFTPSPEWTRVEIKTKNELKAGDIVTLRNGDRLVFRDFDYDKFVDLSDENDNFISDLNDITDDFRYKGNCRDNDIVKVERANNYQTIFKSEDIHELTVEEISKILGYDVKIVKNHK